VVLRIQITPHPSRTPNTLHNAAPNEGQYKNSFQNQQLTNCFLYGGGPQLLFTCVESRWNVMARGDAREGKWKGNWWMEWVASTLHTTSEHGVSSITTADAHNSAASIRLNW
jgi:hypothetical protein